MALTTLSKRDIQGKVITYQDLENWQALTILADVKSRLQSYHSDKLGVAKVDSADDFKAWTGLDKKQEASLADLLNARIDPHFILWTLLRPELLPPDFLHGLALHFCQDFHARLKEQGTYIDHRYEQLFTVKSDWLSNRVSLGNLAHHQRLASQLLIDMQGSNDKKMIAVAEAAHAALNNDPRIAVLNVFRVINSVYPVKKENLFRLQTVKKLLEIS